MKWLLLFLLPLTLLSFPKVTYKLTPDPIDVVIPYHPKDYETIELCIEGIRQNGKNIRRIIVVSKEPCTTNAEWFNEANFPFTKKEIATEIFRGNPAIAEEFIRHPKTRIGWIYQQFLKLYAPLVIPDISPNVLILDADVIFFKPTEFMSSTGQPYFTVGTNFTKEYFEHASALLPDLRRVDRDQSGIVHHMLFQRPIIEDLFNLIEQEHHREPWKAICKCIDRNEVYKSCMSEYEIYFNFVKLRTHQRTFRRLHWTEVVPDLSNLAYFKRAGYVYIASQEWYRQWCKEMAAQNK